MARDSNLRLKRSLGLLDAIAIGLGAVIGAGIFVVTSVAAGVAGPAMLIGLLIAGVIATCNALSSAQLAARYPQSGGTYEYGYQVLNPWAGYAAGWMFLISKLSAAGVVALGLGNYMHLMWPIFSVEIWASLAILLLTIANLIGISKTGIINLAVVGITVLGLLYFGLVGLEFVQLENFEPFAPFGMTNIFESAAILFFAFTGYARIATLAEEVKNPGKTIPQAIIITLVVAIGLYSLVSFIAIGVLGTDLLQSTTTPLQSAANMMPLPAVAQAIGMAAITALLGVLLSQILGISRMFFAMGRRNDLPPLFFKIHPTTHLPIASILICSAIILALTWFANFEFIVRSASFSILIYYGIANYAAIRQSNTDTKYPAWIPVMGLFGCIALSLSLTIDVIVAGLTWLAIGFAFRFVYKRWL